MKIEILIAAAAISLAPMTAMAAADAEFSAAIKTMEASVALDAAALKQLAAGPGADSVVRDQTTTVSIPLNGQTVKCSAADYQAPMLKVLVPALAELTLLNHRNTKEGAPCIAAGACGDVGGPQTILSAGEGVEQVPVRVILKKVAVIDGGVCRVSLVENVSATIRGVPFFHERSQELAQRAPADCR